MRLIDKDATLHDLENGVYPASMTYTLAVDIAKGLIEVASEIDAMPVVRGEWIAEQKGAEYCEFRCSVCDGSIGQTDQFDETEVKQFSEWYKYCPCCGARMDGES